LVYDFLTPDDAFVTAAMRVEKRVSRIAHSLIVEDRRLPSGR
jgi:hypothetical protein